MNSWFSWHHYISTHFWITLSFLKTACPFPAFPAFIGSSDVSPTLQNTHTHTDWMFMCIFGAHSLLIWILPWWQLPFPGGDGLLYRLINCRVPACMRRSSIVGMAGSGQSALSTSAQHKKRKRLRTRAVTQSVPDEQASEYEVTGT